MTKAEIVKSISESTGVDKQASMAVVESFMEIVKESLAKDEIPECKVVKFKASKDAWF